jgi:hypothetical protein
MIVEGEFGVRGKKYPVIENIYGPRSAGVLLSTCGLVAGACLLNAR